MLKPPEKKGLFGFPEPIIPHDAPASPEVGAVMPTPPPSDPAELVKELDITFCRAEVLIFSRQMEKALRKNDHKPGWKNSRPEDLLKRLREEVTELEQALACPRCRKDKAIIAGEAADVGNLAMMVADSLGAL